MTKKFIKNNAEFVCINCGREVPKHPNSSRDHCPYCLVGLHVDINPGDRLNECKGILIPIGMRLFNKKEQVAYKCKKCSNIVYCITAPDDNRDLIVNLSAKNFVDENSSR